MKDKEFLIEKYNELPKDRNGLIEAGAWYEYRQTILDFVDTAEPIEPEAIDSPAFCRLKNGEELTVYNPRQIASAGYVI